MQESELLAPLLPYVLPPLTAMTSSPRQAQSQIPRQRPLPKAACPGRQAHLRQEEVLPWQWVLLRWQGSSRIEVPGARPRQEALRLSLQLRAVLARFTTTTSRTRSANRSRAKRVTDLSGRFFQGSHQKFTSLKTLALQARCFERDEEAKATACFQQSTKLIPRLCQRSDPFCRCTLSRTPRSLLPSGLRGGTHAGAGLRRGLQRETGRVTFLY